MDLTAQCKTEAGPGVEQPWTAFQEVNQRQHSFLTKFLLFALPHSVYKANNLLPSLLQQISLELRQLFYEGVWARGTYWFGTCIGMKGDLAWFAHVGNLKRSYKNLSADTPCCHECLAGTIALPFEDINKEPVWKDSVYTVRPWSSDNPPMFKDIPFDSKQPERILRRDFFHCSKLGTFRDYCGSTVAMLCKLQYFTVAGQPNNMKVLLERAHGHFRLFCATAGLHPALHSFTKDNFNCSSSRKYPWCKTKGSDTMLLLQWLQFFNEVLHEPTTRGFSCRSFGNDESGSMRRLRMGQIIVQARYVADKAMCCCYVRRGTRVSSRATMRLHTNVWILSNRSLFVGTR